MKRDANDLDALLAPLASRRAPANFAARLQQRYAAVLEARRRREFVISSLCIASLSLIVLLVLAAAWPHAGVLLARLRADAAGLTTAASALTRLAWQPTVRGPAGASGIVVVACSAAACCVALAAIIRRESMNAAGVQ